MNQTISLVRGDDRTLTLTVTGVDLTTASSIRFMAKCAYTDGDGDAVFSKSLTDGITVNSSTSAVITIADTDWEDLHYKPLFFDVEVIAVDGKVHTVVDGTIKVRDDVTRTAP